MENAKALALTLILGLFLIGNVFAVDLVPGEDYVEGELLVGFIANVTEDEAKGLIQGLDLILKEDSNLWNLKVLVINVPNGEEQVWIETLEKENVVDYH